MKPGETVDLYARVSTVSQEAEPQILRLRDWAARNGLQIAQEHLEIASGRLVRRPVMDAVMARVRGRHVRHVAVVKLDRWGRSLIDVVKSIKEMAKSGVGFHAIESGLTYEKDNAASTFVLGTLANAAEFEAGLISERTKEGLVGRPGRGRHVKDCGILTTCPSGFHHQTKGMPISQGGTGPESPPQANGRLIEGEPVNQTPFVVGVQQTKAAESAKDLEVAAGPKGASA